MKEIDWSNLSFGYMKTDYNVRINFREGEWGKLEISSSELINLHMAATCLHYGRIADRTFQRSCTDGGENERTLYTAL